MTLNRILYKATTCQGKLAILMYEEQQDRRFELVGPEGRTGSFDVKELPIIVKSLKGIINDYIESNSQFNDFKQTFYGGNLDFLILNQKRFGFKSISGKTGLFSIKYLEEVLNELQIMTHQSIKEELKGEITSLKTFMKNEKKHKRSFSTGFKKSRQPTTNKENSCFKQFIPKEESIKAVIDLKRMHLLYIIAIISIPFILIWIKLDLMILILLFGNIADQIIISIITWTVYILFLSLPFFIDYRFGYTEKRIFLCKRITIIENMFYSDIRRDKINNIEMAYHKYNLLFIGLGIILMIAGIVGSLLINNPLFFLDVTIIASLITLIGFYLPYSKLKIGSYDVKWNLIILGEQNNEEIRKLINSVYYN